jgi:tRNA-specific 2-thiouridylase
LLDLREEFAANVVGPFARDYLRGRTPNPCVACNRDFKLGSLLRWAQSAGARYVATGHYARVVPRQCGWQLLRALDRTKDQSYFLFALSQEQLAMTLFPLGGMQKAEVRTIARRLDLPAAERPESQDICFGDYRDLVLSRAGEARIQSGVIIDRAGTVLGTHAGIHNVTIGQRRGLGVSAAEPLYVVDIDADANRIVLGRKHELDCDGLIAAGINWLDAAAEVEAEAQIRYRAAAAPCIIRRQAGDRVAVQFKVPLSAVTPGQAVVFYRGETVLGGGWIESAVRKSG